MLRTAKFGLTPISSEDLNRPKKRERHEQKRAEQKKPISHMPADYALQFLIASFDTFILRFKVDSDLMVVF